MPGVELSTSACDGHVVVALRGDLDTTDAADAGAAITALVVPGRCLFIEMARSTSSIADRLPLCCGAVASREHRRRCGAGRAAAACAAASGPDRQGPRVLDSCQRAGGRGGPARSRGTVRWAAARGEHCMLWEGSAIAYWYPVIAVGAAAVRAGSLRGWMRGCRQPAHGRVGAGGRVCQLGASRAAGNREYKEA